MSDAQQENTANRSSRRSSHDETFDIDDPRIEVHQEYFNTLIRHVLENQVVPQLAQHRRIKSPKIAEETFSSPEQDARKAEEFETLVLTASHAACDAFVERELKSGISFQTLCLGLFTTVARGLGERWESDELSFVDVTRALGRLHLLVHDLAEQRVAAETSEKPSKIVLAHSPHEQHAFGLLLVAEMFRLEGWQVTGGPNLLTGKDLYKVVKDTWFDVVGLTASSHANALCLQDVITQVRAASSNPDISVLVGGHGFDGDREISRTIGADGVADDAGKAVTMADDLVIAKKK